MLYFFCTDFPGCEDRAEIEREIQNENMPPAGFELTPNA